MRRNAIIPLVLGLGIGLLTVKIAVDSIKRAQATGGSAPTIQAVRARLDIGAYEEITAERVEMVETADSLFAPAADRIDAMDEAIGRVTAKAIPKGAAVLRSMLAAEGTRSGMVGRIPPGYRAVSVKIDEVTGVAYQIKPGDWVDVIVVIDIDNPTRGRKETVAEVILQHVRVAAIGHATEGGAPESGSKVKPAKSATLLVSEEEVPKLHLAATRGKITLAMRGEDEQTTEKPASANMSDVLAALGLGKPTSVESPAQKVPAEPSGWMSAFDSEPDHQARHTVLVYHGSPLGDAPAEVEQITFEHATSLNIVEVTSGLPTRASSTMRALSESPRSRRPPRNDGAGQSDKED